MKSFAVLAYFMAFLTIMCSNGLAKSVNLQRRAPPVIPFPLPDKAGLAVDLILQEQSQIFLNAFANVCTDAEIASSIKSNLHFKVTGLFEIDFGLSSKLSAKIDAAIKAQVNASVHSEIDTKLTAQMKVDVTNVLFTQCPLGDLACIKLKANIIVRDSIKLAIDAAAKAAAELHTKLQTDIEAAIQAEVKKFAVNLWLIKINVTGGVDVSNSLSVKFKAAVDVSAKALVSIRAKIVSKVKAIYE